MRKWGIKVSGVTSAMQSLEQLSLDWFGETLYVVGPTVEYAIWQEVGTSKMEARPYMRPAAERVESDPLEHAQQIAQSQGITIDDEESLVRCIALAVQKEAREIADRKGVRDSGQLISSITIERQS